MGGAGDTEYFGGKRLRDPMLNDLWEYWERLRAGRAAPYRSEIDPRQFERALGNMFILERVAPKTTRFRLAGMKFCDLVGMEVRGMPPGALVADATVGTLDQTIDMVLDEPLVADMTIDVIGSDGARLHAGMLLLPLKSGSRRHQPRPGLFGRRAWAHGRAGPLLGRKPAGHPDHPCRGQPASATERLWRRSPKPLRRSTPTQEHRRRGQERPQAALGRSPAGRRIEGLSRSEALEREDRVQVRML